MNLYEKKMYEDFCTQILNRKNKNFNGYCTECGKNTTFEKSDWFKERESNIANYMTSLRTSKRHDPNVVFSTGEVIIDTFDDMFIKGAKLYIEEYECCIDRSHKRYSIYQKIGNDVIKIGQYPSALSEDGQEYLKKLKSICSNKESKEISKYINKALVMESFGYGIASLLYIRRAFEKLIIISEGKEHENDGTTMKDRIKNNKYLPDLIKKNSRIYNIISEGIHNQSEEECMKLFKIIKVGVMILITRVYSYVEEEKELDKLKSLISSK